MRIGIDARLIDETGVGRYIRNLLRELSIGDTKNEYIVFLRKKQFDVFTPPNVRWQKVLADVPWHGVTEQLAMPIIFGRAKLDLLHVPYFNVPIFYPGTFVVTIHDLTILHVDTGKATTHPWIFYKLRRLGYRLILWIGLARAQKILAVSETTKEDIIKHIGIKPNKIVVTYEGVDEKFATQKSEKRKLIEGRYFLYVGNAYPHKNLEVLLEAIKQSEKKLVLVGKGDFFYKKLKGYVEKLGISKSIVFFGAASDTELGNLYTYAQALVFPSLMEGFGLPVLEALALGCPVMCSDIPVFHEILGDNAMYFNPRDASDIAKKLRTKPPVSDKPDMQRFNWEHMAKQTREIYESSTRI